jgi:hypothetical protein
MPSLLLILFIFPHSYTFISQFITFLHWHYLLLI